MCIGVNNTGMDIGKHRFITKINILIVFNATLMLVAIAGKRVIFMAHVVHQ